MGFLQCAAMHFFWIFETEKLWLPALDEACMWMANYAMSTDARCGTFMFQKFICGYLEWRPHFHKQVML